MLFQEIFRRFKPTSKSFKLFLRGRGQLDKMRARLHAEYRSKLVQAVISSFKVDEQLANDIVSDAMYEIIRDVDLTRRWNDHTLRYILSELCKNNARKLLAQNNAEVLRKRNEAYLDTVRENPDSALHKRRIDALENLRKDLYEQAKDPRFRLEGASRETLDRWLYVYEGNTQEEIARVFDVSQPAVSNACNQVEALLAAKGKDLLEQHGLA